LPISRCHPSEGARGPMCWLSPIGGFGRHYWQPGGEGAWRVSTARRAGRSPPIGRDPLGYPEPVTHVTGRRAPDRLFLGRGSSSAHPREKSPDGTGPDAQMLRKLCGAVRSGPANFSSSGRCFDERGAGPAGPPALLATAQFRAWRPRRSEPCATYLFHWPGVLRTRPPSREVRSLRNRRGAPLESGAPSQD